MYLKMLSIDKFVEINKLAEISDPIYLSAGRPTPNGLFSYDIFGITPSDRGSIWGYINLGAIFLHPLAAINLRRYSRNMEGLIAGVKYFRFEDGEFIEDPEGSTGIDFLYANYDKIKWKTSESIFPQERIKFLQQPKENLFITKFPVTPPFYRDISAGAETAVDKVNDSYKKLISQASALKRRSGSFALFSHMTRGNMQNLLIEVFNYYIFEKYHGKYGVMRRNVMGVDVDRGARLVMSAPIISGERYTDMQVDFHHTGIPLATACGIGFEFVVKGVKDFFDNEFIRGGKYPYVDKADGKTKYLTLIEPDIEFSEEVIKHKIEQFVHGPSTRFESIYIPKNKEGVTGLRMAITGRFGKASKEVSSRPATWTDVLFLVCNRVLKHKGVTITRYPIEDFYCIFHTKMSILSTTETMYAEIGGEKYNYYPVVNPDTDGSNSFADTLVFSNLYLKGCGGDYDGDMASIRLAYTDEANIDIENFMFDKKNYINLMGGAIRLTERDFMQCIYSLTKPAKGMTLTDLN
jgi:DNA-directed RNA polymerase beta' subunit